VPVTDLIEGRKWMDERDVISCLQYRRDHQLTLRQWASSLKGVRETVYYAHDDLQPLWRAGLYALGGALGAVRTSSPPAGADRTPGRADPRTACLGEPQRGQAVHDEDATGPESGRGISHR
jgi:hypothetical protein